MSASAGENLAAVVLDLESRLHELTSLEARIQAVRMVIARVGEADMFRWWASTVWTRAHALYQPIFRETWPKQRLLLLLEAAQAGGHAMLQMPGSTVKSLFRLNAEFDAHLDHKFRLLSLGTYNEVCEIVSRIKVEGPRSLRDIGTLDPAIDEQQREVTNDLQLFMESLGLQSAAGAT